MELPTARRAYTSTMHTIVTESPDDAAAFVRAGETAAFPTETVYGLGADALRPSAVQKIFEAKGRPSDNPLIVHISDRSELDHIASDLRPYAIDLVDQFFPGSLTVVVKKAGHVPEIVTAGLDTVGVRMPAHATALAFLKACDTAVAAPSANRSGRPSPTTWQAVLDDLDGRIPCILRGDRTNVGLESTVVDCTGPRPIVLRSGAVSLETLREVVPDVDFPTATNYDVARSPGLRHRHYAPEAQVVLVTEPPPDPPSRSAYIGLTAPAEGASFEHVTVCRDVAEYAFELFDFFRTCDGRGLAAIFCEMPPESGLGVALADRLRRAAAGGTIS